MTALLDTNRRFENSVYWMGIALVFFLFFLHGKLYPPNSHSLLPMWQLIQHIHTAGHKKHNNVSLFSWLLHLPGDFFHRDLTAIIPSSGALRRRGWPKGVVVAACRRGHGDFFLHTCALGHIYFFQGLSGVGMAHLGFFEFFLLFLCRCSTHATATNHPLPRLSRRRWRKNEDFERERAPPLHHYLRYFTLRSKYIFCCQMHLWYFLRLTFPIRPDGVWFWYAGRLLGRTKDTVG